MGYYKISQTNFEMTNPFFSAKVVIIGLFAIFFLFFSCANRIYVRDVSTTGIEIQVNSKTPEEFYNKWYWSHEEEQQDGMRIYRDSTYNFPLSRGRSGFQIFKSGKFVVLEPGQDDRPIEYVGQWIYDKVTKTIEVSFKKIAKESENSTITTENRNPFLLQIISFDKKMLKLKVIYESKSSGD